MSLSINVKEIVDSCKSKDKATFYKVRWQDVWLHEDHLKSWKHLVDQYIERSKGNKEEQLKVVDTNSERVCYFCNDACEEGTDAHSHEHSHIQQKTQGEVIVQLEEKAWDLKVSKSFILLSPLQKEQTKNELSSLEERDPKANARTISTNTIGKVIMKCNKLQDAAVFVCSFCHEEFSLSAVFLAHVQTHRDVSYKDENKGDNSKMRSTNSRNDTNKNNSKNVQPHLCCQVCGKSFTTKTLLDKHTSLHENIKFRTIRHKYTHQQRQRQRKQQKKNVHHVNMDFDTPDRLGTNLSADTLTVDQTSINAEEDPSDFIKTNSQQQRDFTPEVLNSARRYIKAVSRRRKENTMKRILTMGGVEKNSEDVVPTMVRRTTDEDKYSINGIGVDVELKRSEEALPIITKRDDGKFCYICKVCGKVFYNKFHHREHFNVHSGEMPYECEFCSKRFAQRSGWNRHIKLHHKYEVFEGPIPHSHVCHKKLPHFSPAMPQNASTAILTGNSVERPSSRYVPIVPYPTPASIPVVGEVQGMPNGTANHHQASLAVQNISTPDLSLPKIVSVTSKAKEKTNKKNDNNQNTNNNSDTNANTDSENNNTTIPKKAIFHCCKVRSMDGRHIFMIRISDKHAVDLDERDRNMEFAYVLDGDGNVESRIYLTEQPKTGWMDFPLDEAANQVLLDRIRSCGDKNRRGPKPRNTKYCTIISFDRQGEASGQQNLEKAFKEFQQNSDGFLNGENGNGTAGRAPEEANTPTKLDALTSSKQQATLSVTSLDSPAPPNRTVQQQRLFILPPPVPPVQDPRHSMFLPLPHCGRKFVSGRERRFTCTACGRKFLAQAHLNDHMLIHTGQFPYNCMFCNRPFRHKSGLNSHHKRHIQHGIFDRPLSGIRYKDIAKNKVSTPPSTGGTTTITTSPMIATTAATVEKSKRKQRTPKHFEQQQNNDGDSGGVITSDNDEMLLHIKEEEMDYDDVDMGDTSSAMFNSNHKESISFDVRDMFECNFCGLNFPHRTAYLKHVNTVHKGVNNTSIRSSFDDTTASVPSIEANLDSEYTDGFSDALLDCKSIDSGSPSMVDPEKDICSKNTSDDNIFLTNIKIKEEVIEDI